MFYLWKESSRINKYLLWGFYGNQRWIPYAVVYYSVNVVLSFITYLERNASRPWKFVGVKTKPHDVFELQYNYFMILTYCT